MAWTVKVTLDADKADVGTATATWNAGMADQFVYSRRVKVALAEGKAFAAEAKTARLGGGVKIARETTLAKTLADMLAAEEAKV